VDFYCEERRGEENKVLQESRREASFSALYGMCSVRVNKLTTVLKLGAQAGQSGVMNKTSVEPTTQDNDFQEVNIM
jgi:hypothetical protein